MRLAYCDDEEIQLEYVKALAEKWSLENRIPLQFLSYRSAKELLFEYTDLFPFDLLILDIDMQGMDGMALAKEIRKKDRKLPILFLTNRKEYVFEGYEVGALRYLLKPLEEMKLFPLLNEIYAAEKKEKRCLIETISGETVKIEIDDILYLEVNGHYIQIYTSAQKFAYKKSLSEAAALLTGEGQSLSDAGFVRTHRSFLVNLRHIDKVLRTECVLSDGSRVPVSRNSYKEVNAAFISYFLQE